MGDTARITGNLIRWARERAGLTREELAAKLGKGFTSQSVAVWESGSKFPTFAQAELIAGKLRVPLAILFMREPPREVIPIPDLRTVSGQIARRPSADFREVLNDCVVKQQWYREYRLEENAEPLEFVGSKQMGDSVSDVAWDIGKALGLTDDVRHQCGSWTEFLTTLIEQAEDAGILVLRSSVVKHATLRKLRVDEFRGFAISDRYAPLIFINSRDARAAQIFTLVHELAHIWIDVSGISDPAPLKRLKDLENPTERFCNAVAAELLVPERSFVKMWNARESADTNLKKIGAFHRVSKIVAVIRARELGRLGTEASRRLIDEEYERFRGQSERAKEQKGGPSFWLSFSSRNSHRFTETVLGALGEHRVPYLEAANLLGVKMGTLAKYEKAQLEPR